VLAALRLRLVPQWELQHCLKRTRHLEDHAIYLASATDLRGHPKDDLDEGGPCKPPYPPEALDRLQRALACYSGKLSPLWRRYTFTTARRQDRENPRLVSTPPGRRKAFCLSFRTFLAVEHRPSTPHDCHTLLVPALLLDVGPMAVDFSAKGSQIGRHSSLKYTPPP